MNRLKVDEINARIGTLLESYDTSTREPSEVADKDARRAIPGHAALRAAAVDLSNVVEAFGALHQRAATYDSDEDVAAVDLLEAATDESGVLAIHTALTQSSLAKERLHALSGQFVDMTHKQRDSLLQEIELLKTHLAETETLLRRIRNEVTVKNNALREAEARIGALTGTKRQLLEKLEEQRRQHSVALAELREEMELAQQEETARQRQALQARLTRIKDLTRLMEAAPDFSPELFAELSVLRLQTAEGPGAVDGVFREAVRALVHHAETTQRTAARQQLDALQMQLQDAEIALDVERSQHAGQPSSAGARDMLQLTPDQAVWCTGDTDQVAADAEGHAPEEAVKTADQLGDASDDDDDVEKLRAKLAHARAQIRQFQLPLECGREDRLASGDAHNLAWNAPTSCAAPALSAPEVMAVAQSLETWVACSGLDAGARCVIGDAIRRLRSMSGWTQKDSGEITAGRVWTGEEHRQEGGACQMTQALQPHADRLQHLMANLAALQDTVSDEHTKAALAVIASELQGGVAGMWAALVTANTVHTPLADVLFESVALGAAGEAAAQLATEHLQSQQLVKRLRVVRARAAAVRQHGLAASAAVAGNAGASSYALPGCSSAVAVQDGRQQRQLWQVRPEEPDASKRSLADQPGAGLVQRSPTLPYGSLDDQSIRMAAQEPLEPWTAQSRGRGGAAADARARRTSALSLMGAARRDRRGASHAAACSPPQEGKECEADCSSTRAMLHAPGEVGDAGQAEAAEGSGNIQREQAAGHPSSVDQDEVDEAALLLMPGTQLQVEVLLAEAELNRLLATALLEGEAPDSEQGGYDGYMQRTDQLSALGLLNCGAELPERHLDEQLIHPEAELEELRAKLEAMQSEVSDAKQAARQADDAMASLQAQMQQLATELAKAHAAAALRAQHNSPAASLAQASPGANWARSRSVARTGSLLGSVGSKQHPARSETPESEPDMMVNAGGGGLELGADPRQLYDILSMKARLSTLRAKLKLERVKAGAARAGQPVQLLVGSHSTSSSHMRLMEAKLREVTAELEETRLRALYAEHSNGAAGSSEAKLLETSMLLQEAAATLRRQLVEKELELQEARAAKGHAGHKGGAYAALLAAKPLGGGGFMSPPARLSPPSGVGAVSLQGGSGGSKSRQFAVDSGASPSAGGADAEMRGLRRDLNEARTALKHAQGSEQAARAEARSLRERLRYASNEVAALHGEIKKLKLQQQRRSSSPSRCTPRPEQSASDGGGAPGVLTGRADEFGAPDSAAIGTAATRGGRQHIQDADVGALRSRMSALQRELMAARNAEQALQSQVLKLHQRLQQEQLLRQQPAILVSSEARDRLEGRKLRVRSQDDHAAAAGLQQAMDGLLASDPDGLRHLGKAIDMLCSLETAGSVAAGGMVELVQETLPVLQQLKRRVDRQLRRWVKRCRKQGANALRVCPCCFASRPAEFDIRSLTEERQQQLAVAATVAARARVPSNAATMEQSGAAQKELKEEAPCGPPPARPQAALPVIGTATLPAASPVAVRAAHGQAAAPRLEQASPTCDDDGSGSYAAWSTSSRPGRTASALQRRFPALARARNAASRRAMVAPLSPVPSMRGSQSTPALRVTGKLERA